MARVKEAAWDLWDFREELPKTPAATPSPQKSNFERATDEAAKQLSKCKDSRKRGHIIDKVAEDYDVGTRALAQALSRRAQARREN